MKEFILELITNRIFLSGLVAAVLAQLIKAFLHLIHEGKKDFFKTMMETGGMPSSHSALMTALTMSLFIVDGITSLSIAVLFITFIVMVDAAGLRYSAGQQSVVINKILRSLRKEKMLKVKHIKEIMGHTPTQVFFGSILGLIIALLFNMVI